MSHVIACTGIALAIIFTCSVAWFWYLVWHRYRLRRRDHARRSGGLDVRPAMERRR